MSAELAEPLVIIERFASKIATLRRKLTWGGEVPLPAEWKPRLAAAAPVDEAHLARIEQRYQVTLPPSYRAFLLRFGSTRLGPARFQLVTEGLTPASRARFPLAAPALGTSSPEHHALGEADRRTDGKRLHEIWRGLPKDDGVLTICHYGCGIEGRLILNGPFSGHVWLSSGDAAYYAPFGGAELLHDAPPSHRGASASPHDYEFFAWYENWLDGQLRKA